MLTLALRAARPKLFSYFWGQLAREETSWRSPVLTSPAARRGSVVSWCLISAPGDQWSHWVVRDAGVWGSFSTAFSRIWARPVTPLSTGEDAIPKAAGQDGGFWTRSGTNQPGVSLLLKVPEISSPDSGAGAEPGPERPTVPPNPPHITSPSAPLCGTVKVLPVSGRKRKPSEHTGGNRRCKASSAFKGVFVWGLFSYPLGNFTAERLGLFRQWPKQYPHCVGESFLLPATAQSPTEDVP